LGRRCGIVSERSELVGEPFGNVFVEVEIGHVVRRWRR
jgi:hypothetical protein